MVKILIQQNSKNNIYIYIYIYQKNFFPHSLFKYISRMFDTFFPLKASTH